MQRGARAPASPLRVGTPSRRCREEDARRALGLTLSLSHKKSRALSSPNPAQNNHPPASLRHRTVSLHPSPASSERGCQGEGK